MIKTILLITLGGGIGSAMRYLTSVGVNKYFPAIFPWATLTVNVIGCLIIGIVLGFCEQRQLIGSDLKNFLVAGFCGGYTTFSAFASENLHLFQSGNSLTAFLYIAVSVLAGLLAVWLGFSLAK